MNSFTDPTFALVQRGRLELSVSAYDNAAQIRCNLGAVVADDKRGTFTFYPNNVRTGGDEAAQAVTSWVRDHRDQLINRLIKNLDPSLRAERECIANLRAMRSPMQIESGDPS
jgi:hypothetical protein